MDFPLTHQFFFPPIDHKSQWCVHLTPRGSVSIFFIMFILIWSVFLRYFVTELLGTDLHRLLTSRPLEKQFIQYFLYQILVCIVYVIWYDTFSPFAAWTQICTLGRCRASWFGKSIVSRHNVQSWDSGRNRATSLSMRTVISRYVLPAIIMDVSVTPL